MHQLKKLSLVLPIIMALSPLYAESAYDIDLIKSVRTAQASSVRYYLDQGADVNICVGEKRKTPLMFAIDELAQDIARCTPITVGLEEIAGGVVFTTGGLISAFALSSILWDQGFHNDAWSVVKGQDTTVTAKATRGVRVVANGAENLTNRAINFFQPNPPPVETPTLPDIEQLHQWRPTYQNAIKQIPSLRWRVAGIIAAGVGAAGITAYGIYNLVHGCETTFIKSIQDAWRIYNRKQIINVLLEHPQINLNVINNNNQKALDLVRNHMVDSHNENVIAAMKQIEACLLEKVGSVAK